MILLHIIFIYISTQEILRSGKILLGPQFIGVFPLDEIPFIQPGGFIVNSQSANLPGEHWIAVFVSPTKIEVFDPMGFYYPQLLVSTLERTKLQIYYNTIRYQHPLTTVCGHYCLIWLASKTL